MPSFPLFISLKGRKCLVVGGGSIAKRKIGTLLDFGAEVHVRSPKVCQEIEEWAMQGKLKVLYDRYSKVDIEGAFLVVAATSNGLVNASIYEDCQEQNIFVNVVDDPDKCTFMFPAIVRRGEMVVGISTSGSYPMLAKHIKQKVEGVIPDDLEEKVEDLKIHRDRILTEFENEVHKKRALEDILHKILNE